MQLAISKIRDVVHQEPRLKVVPKAAPEKASVGRKALGGREWRDTERRLYQELSRYYPLDTRPYWTRPGLLANCKHGCFKCTGDIPPTHSLLVVDDLKANPDL